MQVAMIPISANTVPCIEHSGLVRLLSLQLPLSAFGIRHLQGRVLIPYELGVVILVLRFLCLFNSPKGFCKNPNSKAGEWLVRILSETGQVTAI